METIVNEPAIYVRHTIAVLQSRGIDVNPLLAVAGISPPELDESVEFLPAEKYAKLLDAALECEIPGFGLLDGDNVSTLSHGLLGYAMYSSATLGKCIERHTRYQDLLRGVFKTSLHLEGAMAWLRVDEIVRPHMVNTEPKLRYQAEAVFALWAQQGPAMGLSKQWFAEVHLSYPQPDYAELYRDYFNCPVKFKQPCLQFGFDAKLLDRAFSFANETAAEICEQRCAVQLAEMVEEEGVKGRILRYLAKNPGRRPNIEEVAANLHLGERTLRRKLADEGDTYKELLKRFHLDLAREYLASTDLPLSEISYLTGYSSVANFHRAFAAHFHQTPGQFREAVRN